MCLNNLTADATLFCSVCLDCHFTVNNNTGTIVKCCRLTTIETIVYCSTLCSTRYCNLGTHLNSTRSNAEHRCGNNLALYYCIMCLNNLTTGAALFCSVCLDCHVTVNNNTGTIVKCCRLTTVETVVYCSAFGSTRDCNRGTHLNSARSNAEHRVSNNLAYSIMCLNCLTLGATLFCCVCLDCHFTVNNYFAAIVKCFRLSTVETVVYCSTLCGTRYCNLGTLLNNAGSNAEHRVSNNLAYSIMCLNCLTLGATLFCCVCLDCHFTVNNYFAAIVKCFRLSTVETVVYCSTLCGTRYCNLGTLLNNAGRSAEHRIGNHLWYNRNMLKRTLRSLHTVENKHGRSRKRESQLLVNVNGCARRETAQVVLRV